MSLAVLDELQAFAESQQKGIGSTDAAAILGVSPWQSRFSLWEKKQGLSEVKQPTLPMWLGKRLETAIGELYAERENVKLRYEGDRQYKRRGEPWQITHLDFRRRGDPRYIVEVKTARSDDDWGEAYSAEVPLHYWLQVQHQMAVVNGDVADIAVLFGLWRFEVYRVPRDPDYIEKLTEAEREYWFEYCVPGVPPPVDHTDAATRFLRRRHPVDDGLILPATPEQAELVDRYRLAEQNVEQAAQEQARLKNLLIDIIGGASGLRGPGFELTYKRTKDGKPEVAWEAVAAAYREVIDRVFEDAERGDIATVPFRLAEGSYEPVTPETLDAVVSINTKPGKEGYRRWHLGDRKE